MLPEVKCENTMRKHAALLMCLAHVRVSNVCIYKYKCTYEALSVVVNCFHKPISIRSYAEIEYDMFVITSWCVS